MDTLVLRIRSDCDLVVLNLLAAELVASSEKGYREFRDQKGKVFRATDYDSRLKKRIQVPIRDAAEKASKAVKQVAENTGAIANYAMSSVTLSAQFIKESLTNSEFRRRIGLGAGMPAAKLISSCLEKLRLTGLSDKVDEWIAKGTKELVDQYGDDKNPFAQAIRKGDKIAPPKDAPLKDKLEFYAAKHAIYMEVLKKPEKYNATKDTVAKAVAAFVPIAVTMGLTVGFGVGIPLLAGEGVVSVLTSFALGEAMDVAAQKGLERLNVDNIWAKMGVSLLAGVAAGGIVTLASKKMAATATQEAATQAQRIVEEAERIREEVANIEAREAAARQAREAAERPVREAAERAAQQAGTSVLDMYRDKAMRLVDEISARDNLAQSEINRIKGEIEQWVSTAFSPPPQRRVRSLPNGVTKTDVAGYSTKYNYTVTLVDGAITRDVPVEMSFGKETFMGPINDQSVMFTVDGSFNYATNLPEDLKRVIALKNAKIHAHHASLAPEGTVMHCSAWNADQRGAYREGAYERVGGFSPPNQSGNMIGYVKGGKLVPFNIPQSIYYKFWQIGT